MDCSRLLEIQRGTTGLYHGDRYGTRTSALYQNLRFVYLLETFNHFDEGIPPCVQVYFSLGASSVASRLATLQSQ